MYEKGKLNKISCYWFIMICVLYFLRFLFLDADSRSYLLNQIQPIDEMYYNEIAVNIYNDGILKTILNGTGDVTIPNAKCYLIPNFITGIILNILGENYYALRLFNVIIGFLGMLFIGRIVRIVLKKFQSQELLVLLSMTIYVLDFNILIFTRSAVTIMPCIFAEIVMIYLGVKYTDNTIKQVFWLAFCSLFSFCVVYMGVSFFVMAVGIWCFYLFIKALISKNSAKKVAFSYFLGNLTALIVSEILSYAILREHIWRVILKTFLGFGDTIKGNVGSLNHIQRWIYNSLSFWMSNMFRYNPILLILFIASIVIWFLFYRKESRLRFILLLIGSHWLQTTILVNANESKSTISYGAILIFIFTILGTFTFENKWQEIGVTCRLVIFATSIFTAYFVKLAYRNVAHMFDQTILWNNIFVTTTVAVFLWGMICFGKKGKKYVIGVLTVLFFVNTCWLSVKYVYSNNTYDDKNMCIKIGEIAGDSVTVGGYPLGCALYNDTKPIFGIYNRYTEYGMDINYVDSMYAKLVNNYDELYYIGYVKDIDRLNNELLADTEYYFDEMYFFSRTYYVRIVHDADMGIYIKRLRKRM